MLGLVARHREYITEVRLRLARKAETEDRGEEEGLPAVIPFWGVSNHRKARTLVPRVLFFYSRSDLENLRFSD